MSAVPSLCPRSQVHERNETGTSRAGSRHEDLLTDSLRLAMPAPFSKPMVFAAVLLLAVVSLYALKRRCGRAARYYALVAATGSLALVLFNAPPTFLESVPLLSFALVCGAIVLAFAALAVSLREVFNPSPVPLWVSLPCLGAASLFCLFLFFLFATGGGVGVVG